MARSTPPRRRRARPACSAAALALLVATAAATALFAAAAPNPQLPNVPVPGFPGVPAPPAPPAGPGATATSTFFSTSFTATATNTLSPSPTPTDPCDDGRCIPEGKNVECILIQKVWSFRSFQPNRYFLPLDVRPYFQEKFQRLRPGLIPAQLQTRVDVPDLFGNATEEMYNYSLDFGGCQLPRQKFYMTWILADMHQYFRAKGDACASGPPLNICASTFDERADSIDADWANKTMCDGAPEARAAGVKLAADTRSHPARSTDALCVKGTDIEADLGRCGYGTLLGACLAGCNQLGEADAKECPNYFATLSKRINPKATGSLNSNESTKSGLNVAPIVIGSIFGVAVVAGLVVLVKTRQQSGPAGIVAAVAQTLGRLTPGRNKSGAMSPRPPPAPVVPSATELNNMPKPPPAAYDPALVHGAAAAAAGGPVPDTQPLLAADPYAADPHQAYRNSLMLPLTATGSTAVHAASPMLAAHPASVHASPLAMATHAAAPAALVPDGAHVMYVDQFGNPVAAPPMALAHSPSVYAAAPAGAAVAPLALGAAAVAVPNQQQQQATGSGGMTVHTSESVHTAQSQSHHVHEQQHTTVTTTMTEEQFMYFVDEQGRPCDAQGNLLPAGAVPPQVLAAGVGQPQQPAFFVDANGNPVDAQGNPVAAQQTGYASAYPAAQPNQQQQQQ